MCDEIQIDADWLFRRGGLHDSTILGIEAHADELSIHIKDEWWNSEGFPEYPGPSPGRIIARGLRNSANVEKPSPRGMILDAYLNVHEGYSTMHFEFGDGFPLIVEAGKFVWKPAKKSS